MALHRRYHFATTLAGTGAVHQLGPHHRHVLLAFDPQKILTTVIGFWTIAGISIAYMAFFFLLALLADHLADRGRSVIASPIIYTLSLTVYCTAWTFYGSVGLASTNGLAFLPTYLGATLAALVFPLLLLKIVRISKTNGITSIADLISSRYGKSPWLAGVVTIVALTGATPYIALQIQALAASVDAVVTESDGGGTEPALVVAAALTAFSILFGTRNVDATTARQGMVLAIAVEGIVKLFAFITIGLVVTYGMHDGLFDIAAKAIDAGYGDHFTIAGTGLDYVDWFFLTLLSAAAIFVLPRQFQVGVIENVDERHIKTAAWLFPTYLLLINVFVLPIALAGLLAGSDHGDMIVLDLAKMAGHPWLVVLTYLGGLSAAMAMIVVTTVALSTMVSNDLVLPTLLKFNLLRTRNRADIGDLILIVRRLAIVLVMLAGYLFAEGIGGRFPLVSIGLIAFVGVAQFLPALIAGLYWRDANLKGALCGMLAGIGIWGYTLMLPAFAAVDLIADGAILAGPFGLEWLRPDALLGSPPMHPAVHSMIWSLAVNAGLLVLISIWSRANGLERLQAIAFVDIYRQTDSSLNLWRGEIRVAELAVLIQRFVGREGLTSFMAGDADRRTRPLHQTDIADADFVQSVERRLANAVGAVSARAVVASVVRGEIIGPEDVLGIIDETSQVVRYSRQLEQESRALARATRELREANKRLQQLDQMKDDFIATVSHELRTPLTSIRSFSEILMDTPDLPTTERAEFLGIIVTESERLTRLINDVLDLSKIESGTIEWQIESCDIAQLLQRASQTSQPLFRERGITYQAQLPATKVMHDVDADRLLQVLVNLLSNAAKFAPANNGLVSVSIEQDIDYTTVSVADNGPGVPAKYHEAIFEKFHQASEDLKGRPQGTGLGLTICRQIISYHGGQIWVSDVLTSGAMISFRLPRTRQ